MSSTVSLSNNEIWNTNTPLGLDAKLWPFVLLTILWWLWDAKNGEVFQSAVLHPSLTIKYGI